MIQWGGNSRVDMMGWKQWSGYDRVETTWKQQGNVTGVIQQAGNSMDTMGWIQQMEPA